MQKDCKIKNINFKKSGFTLMEILVATTIFALISTAMMSLFNYTLKINRKSDALRQASQSMRGLVETLVKEIHNGQIDYAVINGTVQQYINPSCPGSIAGGAAYAGASVYQASSTGLGLINTDGARACIYLDGTDIKIQKEGLAAEKINPENFYVQPGGLKFYVRPRTDPYSHDGSGEYPKFQPLVTMALNFKIILPTGEEVPIQYQTTLSTNKYDVPNQ